jgi:hypothetical protein
VVACD